ncbi:MAG: YicC/YloC family endoribonuclease [Cardiobacteriaceae bacterium]|nr:YicC/YloC family endoribonuclease [Cardiobacteriaceae bacterium]
MTAFARAIDENAEWRVSVEIKSVNHRFLEILPKIPEALRHLEGKIREQLQANIKRGKIDLWINVEYFDNVRTQHLDEAALAHWLTVLNTAGQTSMLGTPLWHDVLHLPGVLIKENHNEDALDHAVLQLLQQALTDLIAMREREGLAISGLLAERLDDIETQLSQITSHLPTLQEKAAIQIQERIAALQLEADPNVAAQGLALLLAKTDVQEEIDRLRFHVQEARQTLQQEGAIGRRLDFLMQEFNREANTLGSKASDHILSQASVELKVLIEQMREQVQNLV